LTVIGWLSIRCIKPWNFFTAPDQKEHAMSLSWIPNAISIMRIMLILPILALFVSGEFGWALSLFVIAGLSDGIDGYIAKKYHWDTRLGAFLDPAGDKLLVAWSFGTLAYLGHIPVWLVHIPLPRQPPRG
jgi:cardiolipin synthase